MRKYILTIEDFCRAGRYAEDLHNAGCEWWPVRDKVKAAMDVYIAETYPDRKGTWTTFSSGRPFWPLDPREEDIYIEDIAESLAKICRFCGHTRYHYSVAQHAYYISYWVGDDHALHGLLHDASEAMLGDVITPLKRIIKDVYKPIEDRVMRVIASKFGFDFSEESQAHVKIYDDVMLATELRDVSNAGFINGFPPQLPAIERIREFWKPAYAKECFLRRFTELTSWPKNTVKNAHGPAGSVAAS